MGKTGSGKSSLLNSLTRTEHFKVGHAVIPETKEVQAFCGKFKGRITSPDIAFIDTPGFFDTGSRDNKAIASITRCLSQIEDGLNIVLFCFPFYETRLDASMQACWKFLKLVMGRAVYEHVVIVLTHGDRFSAYELEGAVARMTTEFIPILKERLGCKVKEEILIYRKGEENDGLDEVLKYIAFNDKYKSRIMEDLGKLWDSNNPLISIEYLLQHSQIFNKIQDLLLDAKSDNINLKAELQATKDEIRSVAFKENRELREEVKELTLHMNKQLEQDKNIIESLKSDMKRHLRAMQKNLHEKDKEIERLKREHKKTSTNDLLEMASNMLNKSQKDDKENIEENALHNKYQGWRYVACPNTKLPSSNPSSTPRIRIQVNSNSRQADPLFKTLHTNRLREEPSKGFNRTFMAAKKSIQAKAPEKLQCSFRKAEYPKYKSKKNYEA
jgi:hypothetical protein